MGVIYASERTTKAANRGIVTGKDWWRPICIAFVGLKLLAIQDSLAWLRSQTAASVPNATCQATMNHRCCVNTPAIPSFLSFERPRKQLTQSKNKELLLARATKLELPPQPPQPPQPPSRQTPIYSVASIDLPNLGYIQNYKHVLLQNAQPHQRCFFDQPLSPFFVSLEMNVPLTELPFNGCFRSSKPARRRKSRFAVLRSVDDL